MIGANIWSVKLFRTSRGYFLSESFAMLKANRAKIDDRNDPDFGLRETPREVLALTDGDNFFLVEPITVDQSSVHDLSY
jgi:hypothetical protein